MSKGISFLLTDRKELFDYFQTMPESARRQREREIKLELLKDADVYEIISFSSS
jgi:hypothetical protein